MPLLRNNEMSHSLSLTKRESQIAELIAWGASKKDIASRLFISPRTVENTARNIYWKAGVSKANELSAWYFCYHFNIPLSLNPLKKSIIAAFFLILFIPFEFYSNNPTLRTRTARPVEYRSSRRADEENNPNTINYETLC